MAPGRPRCGGYEGLSALEARAILTTVLLEGTAGGQ
jgi:hypothetical protein